MSKAAYNVYAAGGAVTPTYIEDVFSTYLYTGTGATQTITNGIDLSTKGGLIWTKARSAADGSVLIDSAQGVTKYLTSVNSNGAANSSGTQNIYAFSTTGYSLGTNESGATTLNTSAATYVSWTFRKQAKFFDIVTYTGNGVSGRAIPHNLGAIPRFIIVKRTDASAEWRVYAYTPIGPQSFNLALNTTGADGQVTGGYIGDPSATTFPVNEWSGNISVVNASGGTYVAYLFASNAGGFGLTGSDNVITCGSYTGNGAAGGQLINLGYEAQWVMIKDVGSGYNWWMVDIMRGYQNSTSDFGGDAALIADGSGAESNQVIGHPSALGFTAVQDNVNQSGRTYIYIAIRRGPMKVPTLGTTVFNTVARIGTGATATVTAGFAPDLAATRPRVTAYNPYWFDRLRGGGKGISPSATDAESTVAGGGVSGFENNSFTLGTQQPNIDGEAYINWMFRRAPGFFDVVCYTGDGNPIQYVSHNLKVSPELIICKKRSAVDDWYVYHPILPSFNKLWFILNSSGTGDGIGSGATSLVWQPTSTTFRADSNSTNLNDNAQTYVAYLFATCPGVSKVGSYTGNGSSQTIDCGFAAGARFVLIKRTDATGDWYVFDTARGIIAGNDPFLKINSTAAQTTSYDAVDPANSGFIVNNDATDFPINVSSATYIFLAIA